MTHKLLVLFTFFLIGTSVINAQMNDKSLFERKIVQYGKVKRSGTKMTVAGCAATVIGVYLFSSAEYEINNSRPGDYAQGRSLMSGLVCMGVGIPVAITGLALSSVANRKLKIYRSKLQNLTLKINYNSSQRTFGFVYAYP